MNAAFAVLRLELSERGRLFGVAAVLATLPFAIAALPSLRAQSGEVLVTVAMFLAIIYSLALATAFGATTIGAPLAEKRLSFYLSRPIPPASLWIGKFVAAMMISIATFAIVSIPARVAAPGPSAPWGVSDSGLSVWTLAAMPVLFLVTHALSTVIRSRSVRLAFDVVLLLATLIVLFVVARALFAGESFAAVGWLLAFVAIAFLAVLAIAPVYQLSRGRADVRRSHAALSNFLWVSVAGVVAIAASYAWWVTSAPLSSIQQFRAVQQSRDGRWAVATGETNRGRYHAAWLVNTKTGEEKRLGGMVPWSGSAISPDGKTTVAVRLSGFPTLPPTSIDLSAIEAGGRSGSIAIDDWPFQIALSSDASRIVVVTSSNIAGYDTVTGKLLAQTRLNGRRVRSIGFVSPDAVRVVTSNRTGADWKIQQLDLAAHVWRTLGEPSLAGRPLFSRDFSRMVLRPLVPIPSGQSGIREAFVADGRTGARLFGLPSALSYSMLADGRVAFVTAGADGTRVNVTDKTGAVSKVIPLAKDIVRVQGEAGESLILAGSKAFVIVDLRDSSIRRIEGANVRSDDDGQLDQYDPSGVIVGVDAGKKLAAWNLATGEKRRLD